MLTDELCASLEQPRKMTKNNTTNFRSTQQSHVNGGSSVAEKREVGLIENPWVRKMKRKKPTTPYGPRPDAQQVAFLIF